jgi:hypothetical protein
MLRHSYMSTLWRAIRPIANGLTGYSGAILNPIRRRSANPSCLSSGLAWASWGYRWGSLVDAMKKESPSIDFERGFRRRSIAVPCALVHRSRILKLSKSTETTVEARQQGIKLLSRTIIF